jgi:hypothetical protein
MDMTDLQRRWWFANHPEFSWNRTRARLLRRRFGDPVSNTALANDRLRKENFIQKMMDAGWSRAFAEQKWALSQDHASQAKNVAWAVDMASLIGAARALAAKTALSLAARRAGGPIETPEHATIRAGRQAASLEESGGPGKWVEVPRARHGLDHQSKMSGHPIRERDGKFFINEYKIGKVEYDDFRNGILYEYKGNHKHLFDKNNELMPWVKKPDQFRDEALRQAKGSRGLPVIWKVGADQVEAFQKAVRRVRGIKIVP